MTSLPSTMQAAIIDDKYQLLKTEIKVPTPGNGKLLVEISHVAQNPTDGSFDASPAKKATCMR